MSSFPSPLSQAAVALAPLLVAGAAHAQFIPGQYITAPALTNATHTDAWLAQSVVVEGEMVWQSTLSSAYNPGYPGFITSTSNWPAPIASKQGSTGHDAKLTKVANGTSGGPFPSSSSLYFGSFTGGANALGGTLAVGDTTPLANLATLVFQLEIGEASGSDFWDSADAGDAGDLPVLSYNGGTQQLLPTYAAITKALDNGSFAPPGGTESSTLYINTWLMQWDLSAIDNITDFSISFSAVAHTQLYAMRLDQGDTHTAVPEPAALGIAALSSLLLLRRRSHR
jgi:hypothetical protein